MQPDNSPSNHQHNPPLSPQSLSDLSAVRKRSLLPNQPAQQALDVDTRVRDVKDWPQFRDGVMAIERATFGAGAFPERFFRELASYPSSFFVIQTCKRSGQVIGYAMGSELDYHPEDRKYRQSKDDMYLLNIAIDKPFRGSGLLGKLMGEFENHAKSLGYKAITMHAEVQDGYADKTERHYGARVVTKYDHFCSQNGNQRFLKITI